MKVFRSLQEIGEEFKNGTALTLGNFDGIHKAHQSLLEKVKKNSVKMGLTSLVITYFPNPSIVLGKNKDHKNLMLPEEKEEAISAFGIDALAVLPFSMEFSRMSAEDFLEKILIQKFHAKDIVIGFNHYFGQARRGDYDLLRSFSEKYSYTLEKLEPVYIDSEKISSSLIRNHLLDGNVDKAKLFLGRNYSVQGIVEKGEGRGNQIGFPTANVGVPEDILLPKPGVYAGFLEVEGQSHPAVMNLGFKPTFGEYKLQLEVHCLNITKDLYDKKVRVLFQKRLRDEQKFPSIEALIEQLNRDKTQAEIILSNG